MRVLAASLIILLICAQAVRAQSAVTTLQLPQDRIGDIKTAQGITTMIKFAEPVQEIVCGDLYDPGSGKGTFVVQRSGTAERPGNEVFIKPVASKGASNMFVKTGDGKHTYSFDLSIVAAAQAHRVVNVTDPAPTAGSPPDTAGEKTNEDAARLQEIEKLKSDAEKDRQKAAEALRTALQQADRKIAEADAKIEENNSKAAARANQEVERRFIQALMLGLRDVKLRNTRAVAQKVTITLDPKMLLFDDKAYLRYTIQNAGDKDFAFTAVSLEAGDIKETKPVVIEVIQSKPSNLLPPGESLTGVIVFDPKQLEAKPRVALFVRGEGSAELARVIIQE